MWDRHDRSAANCRSGQETRQLPLRPQWSQLRTTSWERRAALAKPRLPARRREAHAEGGPARPSSFASRWMRMRCSPLWRPSLSSEGTNQNKSRHDGDRRRSGSMESLDPRCPGGAAEPTQGLFTSRLETSILPV